MKTNGNPIPMRPAPQPEPQSADAVVPTSAVTRVKSLDLLDGARAVGKWLLLERVMDAEKSAGGIVLPDAVREKPAWVVRSVGKDVAIDVKVGDHVAFDGTRILAGTDQTGKARAIAFAMEGQIMGVLNPEALRSVIITQRAAP